MGPILQAIEEGHFARTPAQGDAVLCHVDKKPWPCAAIRDARKQQANYAESLRLSRLVAPDTRKTYI